MKVLEKELLRTHRKKQGLLNCEYILQYTDISEEIFIAANKVANNNPYHNFGHEVAVAKTALILGKYEACTREERNCLVLAGLFHDAGQDYSRCGYGKCGAMIGTYVVRNHVNNRGRKPKYSGL